MCSISSLSLLSDTFGYDSISWLWVTLDRFPYMDWHYLRTVLVDEMRRYICNFYEIGYDLPDETSDIRPQKYTGHTLINRSIMAIDSWGVTAV